MDVAELSIDVQGVLPEVATPIIDRAIVQAAAKFCRAGRVWRAVVDADYAVPGFNTAGLSGPRGSRVYALISVHLDGREMALAGDEIVGQRQRPGAADTVALVEGEMYFNGTFKGGEPIAVQALLEPRHDATTLPDHLATEWREALIAGAVSDLYWKRGRNGDERRALMHEQRFDLFVLDARARSRSGGTHARRTVAYGGI